VPLTKTNPERIEQIRAWGRDRAVPASGVSPDTHGADAQPTRRVVLT